MLLWMPLWYHELEQLQKILTNALVFWSIYKKVFWSIYSLCGLNLWNMYTNACLEPCQTFKMELSAKIVEGCQLINISQGSSALDVWNGLWRPNQLHHLKVCSDSFWSQPFWRVQCSDSLKWNMFARNGKNLVNNEMPNNLTKKEITHPAWTSFKIWLWL